MTINWTPDINNVNEPADSRPAAYNAPEIRKIKDAVRTLTIQGGVSVQCRQTVLTGKVNSLGHPTFIAAGALGACDLKALDVPVEVSFAAGFGPAGATEYIERLTTNIDSYWSAPPSLSHAYLYFDRIASGNVVGGSTLAPPRYGASYPALMGSLLHFSGTAGSTTFLDDFGYNWTAQGGAKLQTTWSKFGGVALGGTGASNALNGISEGVKLTESNTGELSLGVFGWSVRGFVRFTNLPASGVFVHFFRYGDSTSGKIAFGVYNNAGSIKFAYSLSSTGTSWDIAAPYQQGTTTVARDTDYYIELTYDPVAAVYRMYVNGVQEKSTTSGTRVGVGTSMSFGCSLTGTECMTGYIDEAEILTYCNHPNGITYTIPVAPSDITAAGYAPNWFDTVGYTMYKISAPSTSGGSTPTLTPIRRVYAGDCITGALSINSLRAYAYNGRFNSLFTSFSTNSTIYISHFLGVPVEFQDVNIRARRANAPYTFTDVLAWTGTHTLPLFNTDEQSYIRAMLVTGGGGAYLGTAASASGTMAISVARTF